MTEKNMKAREKTTGGEETAPRIVDEKDLRYVYGLMDDMRDLLGRGETGMLAYTLGRMNEAVSDMYWNSPEASGGTLPEDVIRKNEDLLAPPGSFEWVLARIRLGTPAERFRRRDWHDRLHLTTETKAGMLRVAGFGDGMMEGVDGWDMMQTDWEEARE